MHVFCRSRSKNCSRIVVLIAAMLSVNQTRRQSDLVSAKLLNSVLRKKNNCHTLVEGWCDMKLLFSILEYCYVYQYS